MPVDMNEDLTAVIEVPEVPLEELTPEQITELANKARTEQDEDDDDDDDEDEDDE